MWQHGLKIREVRQLMIKRLGWKRFARWNKSLMKPHPVMPHNHCLPQILMGCEISLSIGDMIVISYLKEYGQG